jgi:hypothetical protein
MVAFFPAFMIITHDFVEQLENLSFGKLDKNGNQQPSLLVHKLHMMHADCQIKNVIRIEQQTSLLNSSAK